MCAICLNPLSDNVFDIKNPDEDVNSNIMNCRECKLNIHKTCFVGDLPAPELQSTWRCDCCIHGEEDVVIKCVLLK